MNSKTKVKPRIILHCQYVYGLGHLVRTVELARGFSRYFQVSIISGGEPVQNFDLPKTVNFIQLPAVYKEEHCDFLSPVDASFSLEECFEKRKKIIKQTIEEIKPDVLITEHFPFGLLFQNEVIELLTEVKKLNPTAKIVSSVRDIIESSGGGKRDQYISDLLNEWYDLVLVHGDENFAGLPLSFSKTKDVKVPIFHTGYVVRPIPKDQKSEAYPLILASVGGGRIGNELLDAIIDCHLCIKEKMKHNLILFSGAFQKDFKKQKDKVCLLQSDDVRIHSFDSKKYRKYLSNASLVISLGGYNSILESVSAKKSMLIYQRGFSGGNEEQDLRIELFKSKGILGIIKCDDLKVEILSDIILNKIKNIIVPEYELNLNGVKNSTKAILDLINV